MRFLLEEGKVMKEDAIYESNISTAKWLIYDVPGNVGWILYITRLIRLFMNRPGFMEIPLVQISLAVGFLLSIAMLVGIAELISERVQKLDRILPKKRLYRGFGTLTWGGFGGAGIALNALFASLRSGYSVEECQSLMVLAVGGALCGLFAGLIFKTFHNVGHGGMTGKHAHQFVEEVKTAHNTLLKKQK